MNILKLNKSDNKSSKKSQQQQIQFSLLLQLKLRSITHRSLKFRKVAGLLKHIELYEPNHTPLVTSTDRCVYLEADQWNTLEVQLNPTQPFMMWFSTIQEHPPRIVNVCIDYCYDSVTIFHEQNNSDKAYTKAFEKLKIYKNSTNEEIEYYLTKGDEKAEILINKVKRNNLYQSFYLIINKRIPIHIH